MRLTRFTDNALRCLIFLAAAPTQTATVQEVSSGMRMSPDHLLKVIRRLVQLRYVRTIRGRRGGVQLAKSAASITVAEIVRSTEHNLTMVPCFEPGFSECPIAESCLLAPAMAESLSAFFAVLERHTIADIAAAAYAVPAAQPVHGGGLVPVAPNELPPAPCSCCRSQKVSSAAALTSVSTPSPSEARGRNDALPIVSTRVSVRSELEMMPCDDRHQSSLHPSIRRSNMSRVSAAGRSVG